MDGRFLGGNKARTHVHAFGPQGQGCDKGATIGHATGGDKGNAQLFCCAGQQNEVGDVVFTGVTTALEAIDADCIAANGFSLQGMTHGGALVNDLDAMFLEDWQPFLRVVTGGFYRFDAALDDGVDIARIIGLLHRGQEGQVDAKGFVGHLAATADFLGKRLWVGLGQGGDHAQATRIGNCRGQFGIADVVHTTLNNRMLDTKEFSNSGFHGASLLLLNSGPAGCWV